MNQVMTLMIGILESLSKIANQNFPTWLVILWYIFVSCDIFFECIHIANSPFFFVQFLLMTSNLSGYTNFSVQLFRLINVPKETRINASAHNEMATWFEVDWNLMGGNCFTNHTISCKCTFMMRGLQEEIKDENPHFGWKDISVYIYIYMYTHT